MLTRLPAGQARNWHAFFVALACAPFLAVGMILAREAVASHEGSAWVWHLSYAAALLALWSALARSRIPLPAAEPLGCVGVVVLLGFILVPNFIRARAPGHYTACKSNLKNLGTALLRFREKTGRYPARLGELAPTWVRALPTCPSAARATYREGYLLSPDGTAFTVMCRGDNHARVGREPDFPQYDSQERMWEEAPELDPAH